MIKKADKICVRRQCTLLSLNRSGLDYEPVGPSQDDLDVMREIDKEYTRHPFYGSRKMVIALAKAGHRVNRKRVQRLMRLMGIEAIAPGPNTSKPRKEDAKYPYLLRGLTIDRPNQVWPRTSRTFRCATGLRTWWPSSTGIRGSFCRGVCPTRWIPRFASTP
jgi:putative transposase